MADYIYPQDPLNSNNNVMNSQTGSLGPDFVYQHPYPPYHPQQPQQPPVFQNSKPNKTEAKSTAILPLTKSSTEKVKTTTPLVTTTLSPEEKFEAELIAEL